jgi:class 3 adenylate cyclase/pimeloyl-ACP methyl ester carboxylesterase
VEGIPETRYARADDGVYLAYQKFGEGDRWFVGAPPIFSNIEAIWEHSEPARFLRSMGSFCRFVHYDKRGQGMSDRVAEVPTLEQRAADMRAVMDAAGADRAVVGGISEGGSTAAMVAATYPERVTGLALFASFARVLRAPDFPIGFPPELYDGTIEAWSRAWGTPDTLTVELATPERVGDRRFLEWVNRLERQSSTPAGLHAQLSWLKELDVRSVLPVISAPALVLHRTGDRLVPVEQGRYLAEHIPGARYVELPGTEHVPYFGDNDEILAELEELTTGRRGAGRVDRVLATVLFTDIVSSTERATALGDRSWHDLLDRHDAMAQRTIGRHGGRVVKATGDGLLATFDGPARGIRCATELVHAAEQLDLAVRAGAHTGEVEVRGDDVAGIAVHIGSRVAGCAGGGEVLVSRTVKDLVAGSGIAFEDRGEHELKGVPDRWQLFRVVAD